MGSTSTPTTPTTPTTSSASTNSRGFSPQVQAVLDNITQYLGGTQATTDANGNPVAPKNPALWTQAPQGSASQYVNATAPGEAATNNNIIPTASQWSSILQGKAADTTGAVQPITSALAQNAQNGADVSPWQSLLSQTGNNVTGSAAGTYGAISPTALSSLYGPGAITPGAQQSLAGLMNPYTQNVIDSSLAQVNNQEANDENNLGATATQQTGAFGGTRGAVAQAELAKNYDLNKGQLISGLLSGNYNQAQGQLNTQNQERLAQQTGLGGLLNGAQSGVNAAANTAAGAYGAAGNLGVAGANAATNALGTAGNLTNAANSISSGTLTNAAAQGIGANVSSNQVNQGWEQLLNSIGQGQTAYAQQGNNSTYNNMSALENLLQGPMQAYNGSGTSSNYSNTTPGWQDYLGAAGTVASLFGGSGSGGASGPTAGGDYATSGVDGYNIAKGGAVPSYASGGDIPGQEVSGSIDLLPENIGGGSGPESAGTQAASAKSSHGTTSGALQGALGGAAAGAALGPYGAAAGAVLGLVQNYLAKGGAVKKMAGGGSVGALSSVSNSWGPITRMADGGWVNDEDYTPDWGGDLSSVAQAAYKFGDPGVDSFGADRGFQSAAPMSLQELLASIDPKLNSAKLPSASVAPSGSIALAKPSRVTPDLPGIPLGLNTPPSDVLAAPIRGAAERGFTLPNNIANDADTDTSKAYGLSGLFSDKPWGGLTNPATFGKAGDSTSSLLSLASGLMSKSRNPGFQGLSAGLANMVQNAQAQNKEAFGEAAKTQELSQAEKAADSLSAYHQSLITDAQHHWVEMTPAEKAKAQAEIADSQSRALDARARAAELTQYGQMRASQSLQNTPIAPDGTKAPTGMTYKLMMGDNGTYDYAKGPDGNPQLFDAAQGYGLHTSRGAAVDPAKTAASIERVAIAAGAELRRTLDPTGIKSMSNSADLENQIQARVQETRQRLTAQVAGGQLPPEVEAQVDPTAAPFPTLPTQAPGAAPVAPTAPAASPPISALKEGIQTTFANGQVWTLANGQPKRVK